MKRVRPAASIEEWVAQTVALAVKSGQRTTQAEHIKRLECNVVLLREHQMKLEKVVKRYETEFLTKLDHVDQCYSCDCYWHAADLFDCDGQCEARCPDCAVIKDCQQCGESRCDDNCLRYCDVKGCYERICNKCFESNTECEHRMCRDHNDPCKLCKLPLSSSEEEESSSKSSE